MHASDRKVANKLACWKKDFVRVFVGKALSGNVVPSEMPPRSAADESGERFVEQQVREALFSPTLAQLPRLPSLLCQGTKLGGRGRHWQVIQALRTGRHRHYVPQPLSLSLCQCVFPHVQQGMEILLSPAFVVNVFIETFFFGH